MSKIVKSQGEAFTFSYTSTEVYEVTPEGIEVPDMVAQVMGQRFAVSVEEGEIAPVEETLVEPEIVPDIITPDPIVAPVEEIPVEPVE